MVKNKSMFYIFLLGFIVLSIMIVFKYTINEGFQANCSAISGCKRCGDTRGCTFCGGKCVNDAQASSQCGSSTKITDSQFCPEVTAKCSDITDCKSCADRLDCTFCKSSNKCVDASEITRLCPRESTVNTPEACGLTGLITDPSGNLSNRVYGQCSTATNCNDCMSTPACYWCSNQRKCVSNRDVYNECRDDRVVNSLSQCSGNSGPRYSENISEATDSSGAPLPGFSEDESTYTSSPTSTPRTPSTGPQTAGPPRNNQVGVTTPSVSQYPNDSIIPVLGLSRTSNGLLTDSSIQIIMDGLKSRGYTLKDTSSKNAVLQKIKEELDYYENTLNTNVSTYVSSSLDYVSDGRTLNKVRKNRQHIQDLKDISRYVEAINTTSFTEAYVDLETEKIKFNDSVQQAKASNFNIELLWFANLVVLGFIFFV
jgi:hypothetical protein